MNQSLIWAITRAEFAGAVRENKQLKQQVTNAKICIVSQDMSSYTTHYPLLYPANRFFQHFLVCSYIPACLLNVGMIHMLLEAYLNGRIVYVGLGTVLIYPLKFSLGEDK